MPYERMFKTFSRYLSAPISLTWMIFGKTLAGFVFGVLVLCGFGFPLPEDIILVTSHGKESIEEHFDADRDLVLLLESGVLGAFLGLFMRNFEINVFGQIGLVMLIANLSFIPPTMVRRPSLTASTSTSIASSRNLSISTGLSGDASTASAM